MKRRNFFSKIAKGLLGLGIVTALPTPEVETAFDGDPAKRQHALNWIAELTYT